MQNQKSNKEYLNCKFLTEKITFTTKTTYGYCKKYNMPLLAVQSKCNGFCDYRDLKNK